MLTTCLKLNERIRQAVGWVTAIGVLTLINAISHLLFKSGFTFTVGLVIGQFMTGVALGLEEITQAELTWLPIAIGFVLIALLSGAFILAGWAIRKFKLGWLLALCMLLYGLDALIAIWAQDLISVIFHGLGVFGMAGGLGAIKQYNSWNPEIVEQAKLLEQAKVFDHSSHERPRVNYGLVFRAGLHIVGAGFLLWLLIDWAFKAAGF